MMKRVNFAFLQFSSRFFRVFFPPISFSLTEETSAERRSCSSEEGGREGGMEGENKWEGGEAALGAGMGGKGAEALEPRLSKEKCTRMCARTWFTAMKSSESSELFFVLVF